MNAQKEDSNDRLLSELDALLGAGAQDQPASPQEPAPGISTALAIPERVIPPGARPRVLVVDDNKDYRDVVHYILVEGGYEVLTAEDGAQGLRMAREHKPNLVLLDFNMPALNGYEVLQELRSDETTRKMLVMMFTGAPHRRHLREMGMDIDDFLEKPISNARLLEAVANVIKRAGLSAPPPAEAPVQAPILEQAPNLLAAEQAAPEQPAPAARDGGASAEAEAMPQLEEIESRETESDEEAVLDIEREKEKPEEEHGLEDMSENSPLVKRLNRMMIRAVEMGASDIHIEPQEAALLVRMRVNGSLRQLATLPAQLASRVCARVKIMSDLVITERRLPQDGQFRATINGKKIEFRVSTLPSAYGEKIVMRVLGSSKIKSSLQDLGLTERSAQAIERALRTPHGLILVTGPTGSGKTTTLYTMLAMVNRPDVNIMTAEDPIEYRLPGITQVHVHPAIGLTFESVLRSFLRQDPNIMLVGEIRDLETADIAVKASITGHLVLSTLHTNSAPATVTRLTHMGLPPYLVAASVKLVAAQRLLKRLCAHCKVEAPLPSEDRRLLSDEEAARVPRVYRGIGCPECQQTGFVGRLPLIEVMPVQTAEMRQIILSGRGNDQIAAQAKSEGMVPLRDVALELVAKGETSLSEALKIILAE